MQLDSPAGVLQDNLKAELQRGSLDHRAGVHAL